MLSIVPLLASIAASLGVSVAAYGVTFTLSRPYAARVASMLRWMYGALAVELGRPHLELLHERRVDRADDDRRAEQQHEAR